MFLQYVLFSANFYLYYLAADLQWSTPLLFLNILLPLEAPSQIFLKEYLL